MTDRFFCTSTLSRLNTHSPYIVCCHKHCAAFFIEYKVVALSVFYI